MTKPQFRAVLDTSAAAAYASYSVDVGEVIAEITAEDVRFAMPALCLAEAGAAATSEQMELLDVLANHPFRSVLPLESDDWRQVGSAARLLGGVGRPVAALTVAYGEALHLVTATPDAYPGVETVGV